MSDYRFFEFDCLGRLKRAPTMLSFENDNGAIAHLDSSDTAFAVEIWCGARLVFQHGPISSSIQGNLPGGGLRAPARRAPGGGLNRG